MVLSLQARTLTQGRCNNSQRSQGWSAAGGGAAPRVSPTESDRGGKTPYLHNRFKGSSREGKGTSGRKDAAPALELRRHVPRTAGRDLRPGLLDEMHVRHLLFPHPAPAAERELQAGQEQEAPASGKLGAQARSLPHALAGRTVNGSSVRSSTPGRK